MHKSWKSLRNHLNELAKKRGFKAELARKMGISPSLVQRYLDDESTPGLDQLDKFAEALNVQTWELLKPEGALPTPVTESPTVEAQAQIIVEQEKRIQALESELRKSQGNLSHLPKHILEMLAKCRTENQLEVLEDTLSSIVPASEKAKKA